VIFTGELRDVSRQSFYRTSGLTSRCSPDDDLSEAAFNGGRSSSTMQR